MPYRLPILIPVEITTMSRLLRFSSSLPALLALVLLQPAMAASDCVPDEEACVEVGRWQLGLGIGLGVRTNPLEDGDDIPLVLLPMVSYTGERFFIDSLDFGYTLWESDTQQLNLLLTPSYDQVFFERWDPVNFVLESPGLGTALNGGGKNSSDPKEPYPLIDPGVSGSGDFEGPESLQRKLPKRHMSGLAGLEYHFRLGGYGLHLHWLKDVTDIHQGEERRLALSRAWQAGNHDLALSAGAVWQDATLTNYYYGVPQGDAYWASYEAGNALSTQVRFDWNYRLSRHWDLRALLSYRRLPEEITASPLVRSDKVVTAFIGGVYHF